jgi:hypothetical protein
MATQMWGLPDIQALYGSIDPGKGIDINRILGGLGAGPWSLDQLTSGANLGGLSPRSTSDWSQVLADLTSAGTATPSPSPTSAGGGSATASPTPGINTSAYMAPQGQATSGLEKLFGGGVGGFTPAAGGAEDALMKLFGLGPSGVTAAPGGAENILMSLLGKGPGGFTPAAGQSEQLLMNLMRGGPGGLTPGASQGETNLLSEVNDPMLTSLAGGKIPPGIMAQFQDQMARQNAAIAEQFGTSGARFGTGLAGTMDRAGAEALNTLLANTEQRALDALGLKGQLSGQAGQLGNARVLGALNAYQNLVDAGVNAETAREISGLNQFGNIAGNVMGVQANRGNQGLANFLNLGGNLMSGQNQRNLQGLQNMLTTGTNLMSQEGSAGESAMQRLFQDYGRTSGVPPELGALMSLFGDISQTGTRTGTATGGGNILGQIGQGLQPLMTSLFSGGGNKTSGNAGSVVPWQSSDTGDWLQTAAKAAPYIFAALA